LKLEMAGMTEAKSFGIIVEAMGVGQAKIG
jgi:hypothetical protein